MSEEVRSHGLNVTLDSAGEGADGLEVLVGAPARRQSGEREIDRLNSGHFELQRPEMIRFSVDVFRGND